MTAIAAATDGRRVVMGGDSAGSGGTGMDSEIYSLENSKVFRIGPWVIGFTTSYRLGQVLRYHVAWPEPPADPEMLAGFLVTDVIPEVRRALDTAGALRTENGQAKGGQFLLACGGQLFGILDDFCVLRLHQPYAAIGAGRHAAYGVLHALAGRPEIALEERVHCALEAAQAHNPWVRAPFVLVTTQDPPSAPAET